MFRQPAILLLTLLSMLPTAAQDPLPRVVSNPSYSIQPLNESPATEPSEQASRTSIPLPPAGSKTPTAADSEASTGPLFTVISSLAIVLGLFCGFVWVTRKTGGRQAGTLNRDLFTVLGTSQIDPRHQAALVKCGDRVLLVALTQTGVTTLTEFTEPGEVNELMARATGKARATFAEALKDAGDGKAAHGFVDNQAAPRRSLFSHSAT
ncbi:Flagellar biosynthesis protein, FliO [Rosistilla carotiformis]|uniref:Flagellar biosynthesis protein, FliO n=1 Tax=Rosistilla carotiformis TaxID=2528017 RepID=A0A518K1U6_9BACT|nr:flagellar biosynthetic protein FliO [Rosistilla carotiformis]QDV71781.1 Flagellar biosynthesis protein, FliO [Rosistilla carotiformis]